MSAKFEKWFANKYPEEFSSAKDGYLGGQRCMDYASSGYNEAIHSLEVTPELVELARSVRRAGRPMEDVLTAVFNAIKEQAK